VPQSQPSAAPTQICVSIQIYGRSRRRVNPVGAAEQRKAAMRCVRRAEIAAFGSSYAYMRLYSDLRPFKTLRESCRSCRAARGCDAVCQACRNRSLGQLLRKYASLLRFKIVKTLRESCRSCRAARGCDAVCQTCRNRSLRQLLRRYASLFRFEAVKTLREPCRSCRAARGCDAVYQARRNRSLRQLLRKYASLFRFTAVQDAA